MYIVDPDNNKLIPAQSTSFKDQNIKERQHLQEWIAKNPEVLGEKLLIIQKEFDGFSDTRERLDLMGKATLLSLRTNLMTLDVMSHGKLSSMHRIVPVSQRRKSLRYTLSILENRKTLLPKESVHSMT